MLGTFPFGGSGTATELAGKRIACVGDSSSHGGAITDSNSDGTVTVNGVVVALNGASHSCPIPLHGITAIVAITKKSYVNGKLILTQGAQAGCGAVITPNDRKVYVE